MYAKSKQDLLEKNNDVISYRIYKERKTNIEDFTLRFFRMMCRLISNGYNTVQAITIIKNCFDGTQKLVIQTILDEIKHGSSFSDALVQFDKFFDRTIIEILRASEMTGRLSIATSNITEYLEYRMQFNTKVKNAIRYPIFVLILILIISIIWITLIIPQFSKIFEELDLSIPTITKCLLASSNFIKNHYITSFSVLVIILYATKRFNIKIPIISAFKHDINKLQFLETMALMLRENVNLISAINCVSNHPAFKKYSELADLIRSGCSFSTASERIGLFSHQEVAIISVSEQTGQYWVAFKTLADTVKLRIEDTLNKTTKRIPSILICVVGVLLILFIYGTFLPLYSSIDVVTDSRM